MARLPTALDLSGPENLRSGRAIAQVDTSGIGRGLASLGASLEQIGAERRQQENTVDIARAEAEKTKGLLEVQNQFKYDPDYSTYGKRAPAKTGEVVKTAANLIRDPQMRERWSIGAGTDALRVNDGINDHGVTVQREAETVAFDNALEENRRLYVDPNTPPDVRAKAKQDIEGAIQAGQQTGLLDPSSAEARRKSYIEDAEFSRGKLAVDQNPSIISKPKGPVAGIVASAATRHGVSPAIALGIAQIESGMNPNAKAGTSSAGGLFQFVDGTAQQYHLRNKFDAEANADAGARLTKDNIDGLRRDLGREPTPGEVYIAHFGGYGVAEKLGKAADNTPVDQIFSPQAIAANRSILAGKTAGEVRAWADRTMDKGIHDAGAGDNPDWYKAISPEQRAVIDNEVDTRNNQIAAETRANIDVATTNAPAAMLNTGQYTGDIPSQEQFFQAYGPQEGASRYNSFVSSMQTNEQAYSMRTMSAGDIQQMVSAAKPTSSGDDAALQTVRYNTLANAQEATIKAREADPATYVSNAFPAVNARWANAQAAGNYQSAVAASIAAQQAIGVKNIQPVPKPIADNAVSVFKDENQPQQNRIGAVASIIMATSDPKQQALLFNQMVQAGLPDITQGAFEALSRGDSGSAQRLFQAAMVDPSKLAGKIPGDIKTSDIDQAVQEQIMDQGQLGDIYYGLSNGTADNYTRAQRDSKLINNAVNIRLRNGETMDQAIAGVSKDLYGDVQVVNDTNMQILVPKSADANAVADGLSAALPDVRRAVESVLSVPVDAKTSDGTKAILTAAVRQKADDLMATGFFRNSGAGYVFIDPKTGLAVADQSGAPIIFQPNMAVAAPAPPTPSSGTPLSFAPQSKSPLASQGTDTLGTQGEPQANARSAIDKAPGSDLPLTDQDFVEFQKRMSDASEPERAKVREAAAEAEKTAKTAYEQRVAEHRRIRDELRKPDTLTNAEASAKRAQAEVEAAAVDRAKKDYEDRVALHKHIRAVMRVTDR
ncbi:transglycosylase SLT domain-containing protein [Mesorhizobium sp. BR1-1-9]|uniref:transglycosylase SLT domain-containing protein n=1 Tax=Mesorhizobium sp. BR1-1-9 TaxID=2876646 RepID=UPI001CD0ECE0|nr:transglycosylase SLT domain-containing protein [Mesorhizobium sp. BR1-1-9]MBZ9873074.1 transglycosylase SLT domain-containing protein [Mesorhizobium sp. BR1-1-9]